jgi:hypothetical protein
LEEFNPTSPKMIFHRGWSGFDLQKTSLRARQLEITAQAYPNYYPFCKIDVASA